MRSKNKLLVRQLDQKLEAYKIAAKVSVPAKGWIYTIRTTLNMTLQQLGDRMSLTKQSVKSLENNESKDSISLKSLKAVGKALDMDFVYGFVPKQGSLQNYIEDRAKRLAKKIVLRTNQTMKLENQTNSEEQIELAIKELTDDLIREMKRSLWD